MTKKFHFAMLLLLIAALSLPTFATEKNHPNAIEASTAPIDCPTATIAYKNQSFCNSDNTLQAVDLQGTGNYTGGTFSTTPGLNINTQTGTITPYSSSPGNYTVTYTIPANLGCNAISVTTTVGIKPLPVILTTTPGENCGTGTVALAATAAPGSIINWYMAATGGSGTSGASFITPVIIADTTFYVEATLNGCTNTTRVPVLAEINTVPNLTIITTKCSADLKTYSIDFTSSGTSVTSTLGTVNSTTTAGVTTGTVSGITTGTNVTLTATLDGCTFDVNVNPPVCNCTAPNAPVNKGNFTICETEPTPSLEVTVGAGETANWYNATGTLVGNGIAFTPIAKVTATYFAEAMDVASLCKSATRTPVKLTVDPIATVNAGADQTICEGDTATLAGIASGGVLLDYTWSDGAAGGTFSNNKSLTSTYMPSATSGTITLTLTTKTGGACPDVTDTMLININSKPTITVVDKKCDLDLLHYAVTFSSPGVVTANNGTVDNTAKTITGIQAGTDIIITSTLNGCSSTLLVTVPNCFCGTVNPPTSGGNQTICSTDAIPALTVTVGIGETADWYTTGGTLLLANSLNYTPAGAGSYQVQARDTITNCVSSLRTPITLTVNPTPSFIITEKTYEPISKTCTINFNSNGVVTSSAGVVNNTTKTITGITPGTEITITSTLNGCTSEFKETIYSYNISGKVVYNVANDNCATGIALQGKGVVAKRNNTTYIGYTNKTGDYEINVPEGTYTLSVNKEVNDPTTISPQNVTVVVQGTSNNYINNFCLSNTSNENDIAVSMYPLNSARPGFEAKYVLYLQNKGYSFVSGTYTLKYDPTKMNFTSAAPAITSNTNGILTWDYSNLAPGAAIEINLVMTIITPPTVNSGTVLNYVLTGNLTLTDKNPQDNEFNYNQTVVNSYDPNDKIVVEGAYINESQATDYLHYITRFQNTGTASAINVVIKETLDSNLDWSTFEPEGSSHTGNIELKLGDQLSATFLNINLEDSTTNEPASHGWIAYKIKPKPGFAIGDIAFSKSDIYFDFNAPIITNTVSTQIQLLSNPDFENSTIQLYPNPVTDNFSINTNQEISNITVFDLNGRAVCVTKNQNNINIAALTTGLYIVEVKTINGIFRKKLIKN